MIVKSLINSQTLVLDYTIPKIYEEVLLLMFCLSYTEQRVNGKTFLKLTDANLKANFDIKDFGSQQEILELVEVY